MSNTAKIINALRSNISHLSPVQWAELKRVLSSDISPVHGPLRYSYTPYLKKIVNAAMPDCVAKYIVVMKGSQIGISIAGLITVLGWIIGESPANTLWIVKDDEAIRRVMQGPIQQMIDSSGLADLIGSTNQRSKRNGATGDTVKGKKFRGGNLYTWSAQSIGSLSELSVQFVLGDEVERWKGSDAKGGDAFSLVNARTKAYKDTKKVYLVSTPEIEQTSIIKPLYLNGNQQEYRLPCKDCGELIHLEWSVDIDTIKEKAGIHFKRDDRGRLVRDSVGYICQKCGGFFKEEHKYSMLEDNLFEWVPTSDGISDEWWSFKLPSLIAPPGMDGWTEYAQQWCEVYPKNKPVNIPKLQTFINQTLAQTFDMPGREVEIKHLLKNTRNYAINTIPNALSVQDGNGRIVLLTSAVDLNGICGDDPSKDDVRLDYEVLAWSESGSSYSIDHGSIGTFERSKSKRKSTIEAEADAESKRIKWTYREGQPNNVWDEYEKIIMSKIYGADDDSRKYSVAFHGIDTGHFTVHAYNFTKKHSNCFNLRGKVDNKFTAHDAIKSFHTMSAKVDGLYLVDGDRVKDHLADNISLTWDEKMEIPQPSGFMNYPAPDGNKYMLKTYFREYEGEKREPQMNSSGTAIGFRWVKIHSSSVNHFWDVRCYNIVVKNIITEIICKAAKIPISWENLIQAVK